MSSSGKSIQFPKGEYLVVKGEGKTSEELNNKLSGLAFGQVLPETKNFAYVGGQMQLLKWDREMAYSLVKCGFLLLGNKEIKGGMEMSYIVVKNGNERVPGPSSYWMK